MKMTFKQLTSLLNGTLGYENLRHLSSPAEFKERSTGGAATFPWLKNGKPKSIRSKQTRRPTVEAVEFIRIYKDAPFFLRERDLPEAIEQKNVLTKIFYQSIYDRVDR